MKNKYGANHGYADNAQQRLVLEEEFKPLCGLCEITLEWSEDIAQGLCQRCKTETYGKQKTNDG